MSATSTAFNLDITAAPGRTVGEAVGDFLDEVAEDPDIAVAWDDASILILRLKKGGVLVVSNSDVLRLDRNQDYLGNQEIVGDPIHATVSLMVEA